METPIHDLDNGGNLAVADRSVSTGQPQQHDTHQGSSETLGVEENEAQRRDWTIATETLHELLDQSDGVVSSRALRAELEKRGVQDARESVIKLKLFNFDNPPEDVAAPDFEYFHRGRSFYSKSAYERAIAETDQAATEAEQAAEAVESHEEIVRPARQNRQEEARLVKYVERALEDIYGSSDYGPEVPAAYDVHNERPGNELENMDVVAVHWRSDKIVELIGVEVKLGFSPKLVQQALNYRRFCNRVWIALRVCTEDMATELRDQDGLLFDYVVEQGIGILGCRRIQGGGYEVWPIHWPQRSQPDPVAQDEFLDRYRPVFQQACVVESTEPRWSPRLS